MSTITIVKKEGRPLFDTILDCIFVIKGETKCFINFQRKKKKIESTAAAHRSLVDYVKLDYLISREILV